MYFAERVGLSWRQSDHVTNFDNFENLINVIYSFSFWESYSARKTEGPSDLTRRTRRSSSELDDASWNNFSQILIMVLYSLTLISRCCFAEVVWRCFRAYHKFWMFFLSHNSIFLTNYWFRILTCIPISSFIFVVSNRMDVRRLAHIRPGLFLELNSRYVFGTTFSLNPANPFNDFKDIRGFKFHEKITISVRFSDFYADLFL